eukprot:TRINITY_DN2500_c0_g1_i4.p2 TRINITY_DN2500_c0_g1~~TRINITY_DN2500_c0_g1_i4.p2  ORF type:complete len:284 (+),score=56.75 TRINITY_DN2500_c0_g1_i4:8-859(+)
MEHEALDLIGRQDLTLANDGPTSSRSRGLSRCNTPRRDASYTIWKPLNTEAIKIDQLELLEEVDFDITNNQDEIIHRIFEVQRLYVRSLLVLYLHYKKDWMLDRANIGHIFSIEDLETIFGNVEDIIGLDGALLVRMKNEIIGRENDQSIRLGNICCTMFPLFPPLYKTYTQNYTDAINLLDQRCKIVETKYILQEKRNHQISREMDLFSLLNLPLKHITQLFLYFKDLTSCTDEFDPEHADLIKTLELLDDIAFSVNSAVEEKNNLKEMLSMSRKITFSDEV